MNKYEKELRKNISHTVTVYELIRNKTESMKDGILDMFLGNLFTTVRGMKSAKSHGANYLIIDDNKAELYHISPKLQVTKHVVTQIVNERQMKKYFDFEGYRYTLFAKRDFA